MAQDKAFGAQGLPAPIAAWGCGGGYSGVSGKEVTWPDVEDQKKLAAYRSKREEWLRLLDGDPVNSVSHQLSSTLWNDLAYRVFNEARRFATAEEPTAAISGLLGEFLDVGYVATQLLAISKLTERNSTDPTKAVISLRRVVDDVALHQELFTRENYVAHDGIPYDPEPAKQRHNEKIFSQPPPHVGWVPTTGPDAWAISERKHAMFDRLCGTTASSRSRGDAIKPEIMHALQSAFALPVFADLQILRHKFVAHAADENNRPASVGGYTLDQIAQAHRIISKVAHTVGSTLLFASGAGTIPFPQFDQFQHLTLRFVAPEHLEQLQAFWDDHSREREQWLMAADAEILDGMPPN